MIRILAIAGIAIRNAVRSRIVIILLALLLAAIVGIPLTVKGDGTAAGHVQVLLRYSIGAAGLILSLATIWAGCAAVSLEIQDRQIQMVVTKPVYRWQIWIGKWLGLVVMNAVLLAFAGAVTYGLLLWTTRAGRLDDNENAKLQSEVLVARRVFEPERVNVDDDARREFDEAQAKGTLPQDVPASQVLEAIRRNLLRRTYSAGPGGTHRWRFAIPENTAAAGVVQLRFRFSSSDMSSDRVRGLWRVGREGESYRFAHEDENTPLGLHTFDVPAEALRGRGDLIVEYGNTHDRPVTVLFDPEDGLRLLAGAGSFPANYARALFALFCDLVFLSALGVAMGSLFSMPVASFAAFCVVLLMQTAGYIESLASEGVISSHAPEPSAASAFWNHFLTLLFRAMNRVLSPLRGADPFDLLADGILIGDRWLASVFAVRVVLYAGVLALLSVWILNRRELARA